MIFANDLVRVRELPGVPPGLWGRTGRVVMVHRLERTADGAWRWRAIPDSLRVLIDGVEYGLSAAQVEPASLGSEPPNP